MLQLSAQQPFFLADFYFFQKIFLSDIFIISDFLLYRKQSAMVRTRLSAEYLPRYLTIPVSHRPGQSSPPLYQVKLLLQEQWVGQHLKTLKSLYRRYPYFEYYFPELEEIYCRKYVYLHHFLIDIIRWQATLLFPRKKIVVASEENLNDLDSFFSWLKNLPEFQFLVYSNESEYYQKKFSNFRTFAIELSGHPVWPAGYLPQESLLVLLFLEGPDTVRFFQKTTVQPA
jgi:hypothetical protein